MDKSNRRPDDTKLGKFQTENFTPLMSYLENTLKMKINLNYFEHQEDFKENEITLIQKFLKECDNWTIAAVENIINITKSSAIAFGILKNLISFEQLQIFSEMEKKYKMNLYGKFNETHEELDEMNLNILKTSKLFYDLSS